MKLVNQHVVLTQSQKNPPHCYFPPTSPKLCYVTKHYIHQISWIHGVYIIYTCIYTSTFEKLNNFFFS